MLTVSAPRRPVGATRWQQEKQEQDDLIAEALGIRFNRVDDFTARGEKIKEELIRRGHTRARGRWGAGTQTALNHELFGNPHNEGRFVTTDLIQMTLLTEARGESDELMHWILCVILNRAILGKANIHEVILSGYQFSGFNRCDSNLTLLLKIRSALIKARPLTGEARQELSQVEKNLLESPEWKRTRKIIDERKDGKKPDNCDKVTHYYDTSAADPDWAYEDGARKTKPRTPAKTIKTHRGRAETRFYENIPGGAPVMRPETSR